MKVYTHSQYSYVRVAEIPKKEIRKIDFALCKQPTETLSSFYNRQTIKPAIVANAGFFAMSTGETVFNYINEGKTISYNDSYQWGMGIIGDADMQYGWLQSKTQTWRDFIGGYPVLLDNKRKCNYSYASEINYKARRTAIGYNDDTIFLVCVENPGMDFPSLQTLMLDLGCNFAINLDGGGSTKMLHNGKSVTKNATNRAVDNVVAIYLKEEISNTPTTAKKNIDVNYQVYTKGKWWSEVKNYNNINSNGYAGVKGNPMQGLKVRLSEGSVQYRVHTVDGRWLPWVTDHSDYAGIIDDATCCFNGKYRVTSTRGNRVLNGKTEFHKGIDLVGIDDTTVYSISDGTVKTAYQADGAGNYVVVTMADGRRVYYMHLKKFLVKNGAKIKKGDALGVMGNTGNSTGAHTHLELRPAGTTSESLDICEFTGLTNKIGYYNTAENIDAIQIRLIGDAAKTHEIKYRVATVGGKYLPWVKGETDYAGVLGRKIDKVQMTVEKK